MKKLTLLLFTAFILLSCGNSNTSADQSSGEANLKTIETSDCVINVIYFHGTQRCKTCLAVEKVTKETIESLYSGNTRVVYTEVNTDDPSYKEIKERFQISWSSLIISRGDDKIDLTDFAFANALKNPELLRMV